MDYLGFEYRIRARGRNEWQWEFYSKKGDVISVRSGTVKGSQDKAEVACKKAIAAWKKRQTKG
jgi:hypothetical protein